MFIFARMLLHAAVIVVLIPGLHSQNDYHLRSVDRKANMGETDYLTFDGNKDELCPQFCPAINAYSVSAMSCKCRCSVSHTYVVKEKKCVPDTNVAGDFYLSSSTGIASSQANNVPRLSLQTLSNDGMYILHCANQLCASDDLSCSIDLDNSRKDVLGDESSGRLASSDQDLDFMVTKKQSRSMLKFKKDAQIEKYRGVLMHIGFKCSLRGRNLQSFSAFSFVGVTTGIIPTSAPQVNNSTKSPKEKESSGQNMDVLIVAIVLAIFLLISCILLIYMFRRWRRVKNRTSNHVSQPPVASERDSSVYFVREKSQKNMNQEGESSSNDNIYNSNNSNNHRPVNERKNGGTIKALYATIDKLFKRKSTTSLDEGYTTDDNYDYKRFSAFPKELYDQPGSVISSLDEPDYRIPEHFDPNINTEHLEIAVQEESEYLQPVIVETYSTSAMVSHEPEPHYDKVGETIIDESPYDEVGEVLSKKVSASMENLSSCPFAEGVGKLLTSKTKLSLVEQQRKILEEKDKHQYAKVGTRLSITETDDIEVLEKKEPNDTEDNINPYDEVGAVLANKLKLNDEESSSILENSDDSHPYDKVGQVVPGETEAEHEYDEPDEEVEYDEPDEEIQYDEPNSEDVPIGKKERPPRPPPPKFDQKMSGGDVVITLDTNEINV